MVCILSSTLQTVWCRNFSKRSKLSVSALYGAGRRPVLRLQGEATKAPNLAPAFSSTLQIVWCRKFSETPKLSVSALHGAGRRPVLRLEGAGSTYPCFQSTKLGACIISTLQIVWCRKYTSKLSVSALHGAGRRPVLLEGAGSTQPCFQSTKLGACIQFHTANSLVQKVFRHIETFCVCSLWSRPTPSFAVINRRHHLTMISDSYTWLVHSV